MSAHDRSYLLHIQEFISRVTEYTKDGRSEFIKSPIIQDAVVRNIELIGEAVKNLSDTAKVSRPEIPWRSIARMRDKIIHHYFALNLELVWEVVDKHLPPLSKCVDAMLRDIEAQKKNDGTP